MAPQRARCTLRTLSVAEMLAPHGRLRKRWKRFARRRCHAFRCRLYRSASHRAGSPRSHFYSLGVVRNGLAISALEQYSLTTVLFPAAVGIACVVFVAMVAYR